MFHTSAEFYDLIYAAFKDYPAEAAQIAALLRRHNPACRSVLDVACGTGEHARRLAGEGLLVDGLDLEPAFVRIAQQKHPAGRFVEADMGAFALGRSYDAVLCLFGSIGYLKSLERLAAALTCFREHLAPGGVVLVEPWFEPGVLDPARVTRTVHEADNVRVTRETHVELEGRVSRLVFDYEITDGTGARIAHEIHELGLFTAAEMLEAFRDAGLDAAHDPQGLTGRGLFAARASSA